MEQLDIPSVITIEKGMERCIETSPEGAPLDMSSR